jgi:hypothetical protein
MEMSGANKVWLAFGEGKMYANNNVGRIIQMLEAMQDSRDMEILRSSFTQQIGMLTQFLNTLKTDPSRNLVYKVSDIPMLESELNSIKILASLHLREAIKDDFVSSSEEYIAESPINSTHKEDFDLEEIIQRVAKATGEEIYKRLKKK